MSEWKKVKIGDVCKIVKGSTGIARAEPGEYPLVVTAEERKSCSSYQFDCEAVCIPLVSSSGHGKKSLKNVHYQSGKFALGTILCAVIPNDSNELDARFLRQYLLFYKDTILVPLMKGAANVSLSMKDIATVEIPLPPIEKQRELSELFVLLQEKEKILNEEYEKQFEYTKQLRQNILQDAIEGRLTEEWRKNNPVVKGNPDFDAEALFEKIQEENGYKISKIDKTEYGWCFSILGNFVKLKIGGTPSRNNPDYWKKEIPWVSSGEVANCEIYSTKEQISLTGSEKSAAKILPKGTVLIAMIGQGKTRGQSAILRIEAATNQNVCAVLLPNKLIKSEYMYIYFCSRYEESRKVATGGNQAALSGTKISQFLFSLPPLAEQAEIVRVVEAQLAKVDQLENQIAERETLTKRLMQSILKDVFREV